MRHHKEIFENRKWEWELGGKLRVKNENDNSEEKIFFQDIFKNEGLIKTESALLYDSWYLVLKSLSLKLQNRNEM